MNKNLLKKILKINKAVFSFKELVLLSRTEDIKSLKSQINYYTRKGELYQIRRGLYSKNKNYDRFELANKIYTPSYISFETVLSKVGIIFQYYKDIFVATYKSKTLIIDNQSYNFKRIKTSILVNDLGIDIKENYSIASVERAFLDVLYLSKNYHFDNLEPINWDKVFQILPIYKNKRMEKVVNQQFNEYKLNKGQLK